MERVAISSGRDASIPVAASRAAPVSLAHVRGLLRGLNREQRRAVTHGEGPLLVVAGPGTGKTEVITRRAAWLIATKRARPAEILALTFTDKAADEMQARVDLLVPYGQADTAVHTFHAFGDRLVREFAYELGLSSAVRVVSRAEAVMLLHEHLFELGLERYRPLGDPTRFLGALVDLFARAKDEGISAADYVAHSTALQDAIGHAPDDEDPDRTARADHAAAQAELARAYTRYQDLLARKDVMDFGDQVSLATRLLRQHAAVREEVRARYRYVLVDEFQDTNPLQLELVRCVAGPAQNVTVVGDDDQSIYTFRGAALGNVLGFEARFPGHRRIVLRRNYRSRAPILAASRRLIRHNDPHRLEVLEGLDKTLVAVRRVRRPPPVRQFAFRSVSEEADTIAAEISDRVASGASPRDFALLVRTNAEADPYLRSLAVRGLPCRFSGASHLFAAPEVRELLAFLRTVADPDSTVDLYALATGEPYGLGGDELTAILGSARRRHRSLWSVCRELDEQPGLLRLSVDTRQRLAGLVEDVRAGIALAHRRPAGEVLFDHLRRSGRLARLAAGSDPHADQKLQDVARFFEIVRARSRLLDDDRVAFVVPHLDALLEAGHDPASGDLPDDRDAVAVLTVHKAKGLEFPIVFIVGLVEGRFPGRGRRPPLELPAGIWPTGRQHAGAEVTWAEERRLFYVAMTRARDELVLTHAVDGHGRRARRPSPFLAEALDRSVPALPLPRGDAPALLDAMERAMPAAGPAAPIRAAPTLTGGMTLSYSQVDDYRSCPLRYKYRHVIGLPTPPHHALVVGSALHQSVAAFHLAQARGRTLDEGALIEVLATHWTSEGFVSREHEEARFAAACDALRRFRRDQIASGDAAPTAVERPFVFRLGEDVIRGRYDRLDETEDGVVITDYKSSDVRDADLASRKARDSLQLQIYALAHEAESGRLPAAVQLHFLESEVTGRATPDPARLERARAAIGRAADGIRNGEFAPRPDHVTCGHCPYRTVCPSSAA